MLNIDFSELIISKKNVLTSERQNIGNIIGEKDDSILVEDPGINDSVLVIPKSKIEVYDGAQLILGIPTSQIQSYVEKQAIEESTTVPLLEERLNVSKQTIDNKFAITKEPITEIQTIEVSVTHEEISFERRKPESGQTETDQKPITSREVIEIPVKREEIEVTKSPYVKDEVVIKKKPVTEVKEITEEVSSERINTEYSQ
ncbi:MAG TPA: YsnF/AvaK domain-containing protein [Candidatus Saccharimonadales bacterium]|nr:YsnF/AvaK domain-containing protein [Candidatus Saccharimonadales bacterium]